MLVEDGACCRGGSAVIALLTNCSEEKNVKRIPLQKEGNTIRAGFPGERLALADPIVLED